MTDKIEEKKEIFNQKRQEFIDMYDKNENYKKELKKVVKILLIQKKKEKS